MKIFEKSQEKELKKICEYIISKDPEISKMGIQYLRASTIYKNLRPLSLFYYPTGGLSSRIRMSTFIKRNIHILFSDTSNYNKTVIRTQISKMFEQLLGKDVRVYFRREFINTAKIL